MANSTGTANKFTDFNNVRISPPYIHFEVGFKKEVKAKFTIQNVGKTKVFIRICDPKTQNYIVDCFPRGKYLSPGLKITNRVKVEYTPETPSKCILPIFINDERYEYMIMRKTAAVAYNISPEFLDFGLVNAGNIHNTLTIIVENRSSKDTVYHVDITSCDECIVVEPARGLMKGYSANPVNVRAISFTEKLINTKIFVRCGHVVTEVPIKAKVIMPILQAIHPNAAEHFTLLEFPPTYFGLKSVVNLFVRNYSAAAQMFSTTGEVHHKRDNLVDLKKNSINFKFFTVFPGDGMFQEDETKLFQFAFEPKELDIFTKYIQFYFCTVVIHRFQCGSLNIEGNIFASDSSVSFMDEKRFFDFRSDLTRDFIRVHLYATAEVSVVTVVPQEIILRELVLHKCEIRVIEVTNKSETLPIYLRYKKIPFVHLEKAKIFLRPLEKLQLAVTIIPCKLGNIDTELVFHLMFYDFPRLDSKLKIIGEVTVPLRLEVITQTQHPKHQLNLRLTPNYIKEVGKHCQGVRFNTKIQKAKAITVNNVTQIDAQCPDLVAFPNDTQQSLRPFRSTETYKTIFTRTGRYVAPLQSEYEMNLFDYCFKKEVKNYYTNYLRTQMRQSMAQIPSENQKEYHVTKQGAILCTDLTCAHPLPIKYKQMQRGECFIPLTPQEMDNILIFPPIIKTNQIAANSAYIFKIFVQNNNDYPIRFILTSDRLNLLYVDGSRHTIVGRGSKTVRISYNASFIGYYTSNIYLIINESTVLTIPIFAQVIYKHLHVNTLSISFNKQETHKYLKMENKLNVPISFNWVVINSNFTIEPCVGCVPEGRMIYCVVRYHCNIDGPSETEAQLYSGEGQSQKVLLSSNIINKELSLINDTVDFGNVPLNEAVTNFLLIRNNDSLPLKYCVDGTDIPSGLKIRPMEGMIPGSSQFALYITAKFLNCIRFNYTMKINGFKAGMLEAAVVGTVVYPDIIISPSYFNLPKISASMTASLKFTVKNASVVAAKVRFEMEEYDEFKIAETEYTFCDEVLTSELVIPGKCEKILYIHFLPSAASSCLFYLPIVVNGILGPPLYSDVISTKVEYYLTEAYDYCKYIKTPSTIPSVKVRTLVTPEKIYVSKKFINFVVNGSENVKREHEYSLVFCNMQHVPEDICLRIENVNHPFYLNYKSGNEITSRSECALIFSLEPNEKTVFSISFHPGKLEFGEYRAVMTVSLRSDMSVEERRVIIIKAIYNKPIIKTLFTEDLKAIERIRFNENYIQIIEPIPFFGLSGLNVLQEMRFIKHLQDCKIYDVDLEDYSIKVVPNSKTVVSEDEYTVFVMIRTKLREPLYSVKWRLDCSCGALWERHVSGVAEDSILSTFGTATLFKDWPNIPWYHTLVFHYPFFPSPNDDSFIHMNDCVSAAKDWLCTQVFFGQWSYEIPDSINFPNFEPPNPECARRQTQLSRIPIIQVMTNLLGPQAMTYFTEQDIPNGDEETVIYLYMIYTKMIQLLELHGSYLPYLLPEYLFNYRYFTYYKDHFHEVSEPPYTHTEFITEFEEFNRLSKQTWLNIILQIYKSLYLERLVTKHELLSKSDRFASTPLAEFFSVERPRKFENFLSLTESEILNWLEFHYNSNKHDTWLQGKHLEKVNVDLLNNSLNNGIVFAVVIATYCPYLKHWINDFYLRPESPEEIYHNITKLIKCMEVFEYTFTLEPEQIIEGNPLRLLMLSAYLFEVLPYMYPTETMTLKAGLATKSSMSIEIYNENEFPIAYKPIFVGEHSNQFSANGVTYEVQPRKKKFISITYWARFAKEVQCTLILSGEVIGYRYVTNKCVSLIGIPQLDYAVTKITYPQEVFLVECVDFKIASPYKVEARYDMQQTYETIHEPLELSSVIYHFESDRIGCARLVATNKFFDFDENGQCTIHTVIGTTSMTNITMWLYFRNATVGDFAIKFVSVIKNSTRNEKLTVKLPKHIEKLRERPDCLFLKIPNRNNLFFNSMKNLLVNLTEGDESALWKRIIDTPIGVNILENLFSTTDPNSRLGTPIRCKSAEYIVVVDEAADVILPEKIVFDDECSSGFAKIPLILKEVQHYPQNFKFTMESKDTQRKRYYYVIFTSQ